MNNNAAGKSEAYRAAGVDIDLSTQLLNGLKQRISSTRRPECLAPIGGFGGMYRIDLSKWKKPVTCTSIDGVGTKLMIAQMAGKFEGVGHDIVNHCCNDIGVQGAEPAYFVDYVGTGKLKKEVFTSVVTGIADACKAVNMTLIGGETAEMPGMYGEDFDLVGCITGMVEEDKIIDGTTIRPGHVAIGLKSNGLHTNGYSLARKVLFETAKLTIADKPAELQGQTLGDALLAEHKNYWPVIKACLDRGVALDGMAHITGGGLYDNVPRILPDDVDVVFQTREIETLPIFTLIQKLGDIEPHEMYRVFNMGCGMVFFVPPEAVQETLAICRDLNCPAAPIGTVTKGSRKVNCIL